MWHSFLHFFWFCFYGETGVKVWAFWHCMRGRWGILAGARACALGCACGNSLTNMCWSLQTPFQGSCLPLIVPMAIWALLVTQHLLSSVCHFFCSLSHQTISFGTSVASLVLQRFCSLFWMVMIIALLLLPGQLPLSASAQVPHATIVFGLAGIVKLLAGKSQLLKP